MALKLRRLPLLVAGVATLIAGLWAALVRLGWALPTTREDMPLDHGPLMVCGFLGTVIALERAVGLGARWAWAGPIATALGAAAVVVGRVELVAPSLFVAGAAVLCAVLVTILRRQPTLHGGVLALAALLFLGGNALWLAGAPIAGVAPFWIGFLVLTVAGERLELNRLVRPPRAAIIAFLGAGLLLAGGILLGALAIKFNGSHDSNGSYGSNGSDGSVPPFASFASFAFLASPAPGARLLGAGAFALAVWLGRYDVARRTVRQPGLTRFIALCLLSGYAWLAVGGALFVGYGALDAGPVYDAALHAILVGFVLSMIFGHAPIVFPAILSRPMRFDRGFYAHLALLHAGLVARVAGDLSGDFALRRWGSLANVIAVLLFLGNTARGIIAGRPRPARTA